jgi:hypothetical protein
MRYPLGFPGVWRKRQKFIKYLGMEFILRMLGHFFFKPIGPYMALAETRATAENAKTLRFNFEARHHA